MDTRQAERQYSLLPVVFAISENCVGSTSSFFSAAHPSCHVVIYTLEGKVPIIAAKEIVCIVQTPGAVCTAIVQWWGVGYQAFAAGFAATCAKGAASVNHG